MNYYYFFKLPLGVIIILSVDSSKEWSMIPARERERLGLVNSNDGEFW